MAEMSNYLENALINAVLRNTSYTSPATVYLGLYTTDPTDADTGTEVSGNAYARQSITFGAPSNGVTTNTAAIEFPQATGSWGTVAYVGIRDASTGVTCCSIPLWMLQRPLPLVMCSVLRLVR